MDRICLVTGGSRGIGAATVRRLAAEDTAVVCNYRADESDATAVVDEVRSPGGAAAAMQADVTDPEAVQSLRSRIHDRFGRLDVVVANAGIVADKPFARMSREEFDAVVDGNLGATRAVANAFYGDIRDADAGRLITVSSIAARHPRAGQSNYAAAKAGIEGFTRAIAVELARADSTANCVAPGVTDTPMIRDLPEDTRRELRDRSPRGRFARPAEVADVIGFLASESASFVSGETITVTGAPIT